MFIFKFAGQTLNKRHFWSKIGDTAPLKFVLKRGFYCDQILKYKCNFVTIGYYSYKIFVTVASYLLFTVTCKSN
jgi:hypothetical protein